MSEVEAIALGNQLIPVKFAKLISWSLTLMLLFLPAVVLSQSTIAGKVISHSGKNAVADVGH